MNYKKLIATALAFGCVITTVPAHDAQAATIKIGYGGQTRYYNGKQLTFDYKGTKLSSSYVGIQIDKVNMVPYYDYLVKQGPKVKRTYTKSSGKLVLKYGSNKLTAYTGKKTYYLNGVKKTFAVAPTKVKYYSTGKTIILMPANTTIKNLGMKYSYNSSAKRISIDPKTTPTAQGSSSSSSSTVYTNYGTTLSSYVKAERKQHPSYGGKSISEATYKKYIDPSKDTTNNYQFLRLKTQ